MKKLGLIVNPIAGMGGAVGLKGTDGDIIEEAIKLGAEPVTPHRVDTFLSEIKDKNNIYFYVAPEKMGESYIKKKNLDYEVVGEISIDTDSSDTKQIAKQMLELGIDLLIFCGGDGTARDIYDAIDLQIPVIAIPAGVKMFSSVFAVSPTAASKLLESYMKGTDLIEKEVLDIDEVAYREDKMQSKLYGYLKVPKAQNLIQAGKKSSRTEKSIKKIKKEIANYVIDTMLEDCIYFLGPGTTVKNILKTLDLPYILLGIDAVCNKELVAKDVNEKKILELIPDFKIAKIIVSPIGGQGFIFGRGSKQFTPDVLRKIGKENIMVVSTEDKLKDLDCLRVDTGDKDVDEMLKGFIKAIIGYNKRELIEIK
ncbi:MAG: ATP-NAD kinase family protein [Promethearchaeati archaeon]